MKKITFTCETVTPLFLAGADGTTPELRAPSIKGALRFWWRAINGGLPLDDIKNPQSIIQKGLRTREGEIFGATDQRSSFALRVQLIEQNDEQVKLFNQTNDYVINYPGIHYLLYSTFLKNNEKVGYPEGSTFELMFSLKDNEHYTEILKALTALLYFGALGTRSRRGAGAFRVKKVKLHPDLNDKQTFSILGKARSITTPQQLKEHYSTVQTFLAPTANNGYSTLKNGKVYIFEPQKDWKGALNLIGEPFKSFREIHKSDIKDTPNFGFPIVHGTNQRSTMPKTIMQGGITRSGSIDEINRRASPLLFRVVQTTDNTFFPLIIWLNGDLLPYSYEIMDTKGGNNKSPDLKIIQDFINMLSPTCMVNL